MRTQSDTTVNTGRQCAYFTGQVSIVQELMNQLGSSRPFPGNTGARWARAIMDLFLRHSQRETVDGLQLLISRDILDFYIDAFEEGDPCSWFGSRVPIRLIYYSSFDKQLLKTCQAKLHWHEQRPKAKFLPLNLFDYCPKGMMEADIFSLMVVADGQITPDTVQEWAKEGISLLHLALCYFGAYFQEAEHNHAGLQAWLRLIGTLVILYDGNVNFRDTWWISDWDIKPAGGILPLTLLLKGAVSASEWQLTSLWLFMIPSVKKYARMVQSHLRMLVAELKRGNPRIDLVSLGEGLAIEVASLLKAAREYEPRVRPELCLWEVHYEGPKQTDTRDFPSLCIANITYGPEPEDWYIEWEPFYEPARLIADFWNLMEPPPLQIPGAWPDEED